MDQAWAFTHEAVDRTVFGHSWGDDDEGYDAWGGVAAADFDGDGRDEYATGGRRADGGGFYFLYDRSPEGDWTRHELIEPADFRPGVGATATDLDGDGRPEIVCGEWGRRLFSLQADPSAATCGDWQVRFDGFENGPHDILSADVDGDGADEIIAREKDGRLVIFPDPQDEASWEPRVVARDLDGDGTAVARLSAGAGVDIVTNRGVFVNEDGAGETWVREPLMTPGLDWDDETRVAVGDVDGDGNQEIVITESELAAHARLAVLSRTASGPWDAELVFERTPDRRAMHTLELVELDGDGRPEILTAEMENDKTDGVDVTPRWWCLDYDAGDWHCHVLLDENLGSHCARVLDVDGDGAPDIVGKVWRANDSNGADGRNHVDCLRNVTGT